MTNVETNTKSIKSKIIIKTEKVAFIQHGHPWVFPKAIQQQENYITADLVAVESKEHGFLGIGVYNDHSLYRVRMLTRAHENIQPNFKDIIFKRLQDAIYLREKLNLPNQDTSAFRMFNSEGDGLSGLTIDRFADVLVVSSSAYWIENQRNLIINILSSLCPAKNIHWLSQSKQLTQDGWNEPLSISTLPNPFIIKENGIKFHIDAANSQKTGLYLDQRDNHELIASFAKDKKVLDLYTYTGGFALNAAKGGASFVLAVDSSMSAIATAKENADLNEYTQIEWVKADAREYLYKASEFDIIILDPPKLMPSKKVQVQAKNYYRFLHREIFKVMRPYTLFMTCNCSSGLKQHEFIELIYHQALYVNKTVRILSVRGPAVCHPTIPAFSEGQYLTAVFGVVL